MCFTSKREERVGKDNTCCTWQKCLQSVNLVADQANTERPGMFVWCSLTVAKHQGPYAHNQNDRHRSPQTTGHVRLHMLIRFARTCVDQRTSNLFTDTTRTPIAMWDNDNNHTATTATFIIICICVDSPTVTTMMPAVTKTTNWWNKSSTKGTRDAGEQIF